MTSQKNEPWSNQLEDPTKRPEYEILRKVIEEQNPKYTPPIPSNDPESNRQMLKQMLREAHQTNPYSLTRVLLDKPMTNLARDYSTKAERRTFNQEVLHWSALHLDNRYADQDIARGDGQRKSIARSANAIEYWDPAKGGLVTHMQQYFSVTLKPDLLEAIVGKRRERWTDTYSLEHAMNMGLEPTAIRDGIELRNSKTGDTGEYSTGVDGRTVDGIVLDLKAGNPSDVHRFGPTETIKLLTDWLTRQAPELAEACSRGDRASRLAGVKAACSEVISQMGKKSSEVLVEDQHSDAKLMRSSVAKWDPRRVPWENQFPEIIPYLQRSAEVEAVKKALAKAACTKVEETGFLFPEWEQENTQAPIGKGVSATEPTPVPSSPEEKLAKDNRALAALLAIKLPEAQATEKQSEISRDLAVRWADTVLCPAPTTVERDAEVIVAFRHQVIRTAQKWEFDGRNGMQGLLSRSLANLVEVKGMDQSEAEISRLSLGGHIQQATELCPWVNEAVKTAAKPPPSTGRFDY